MSKTNEMMDSLNSYRIYVLGCWQEGDNAGEPVWRFSLMRSGEEGQRYGFRSLDALLVYLRRELAGKLDKPSAPVVRGGVNLTHREL